MGEKRNIHPWLKDGHDFFYVCDASGKRPRFIDCDSVADANEKHDILVIFDAQQGVDDTPGDKLTGHVCVEMLHDMQAGNIPGLKAAAAMMLNARREADE